MGRSHMASGALVGAGVAWAFQMSLPVAAGFTAITTAATLLPDFDHPEARGPRSFGWPGQLAAWILGGVFGHRGITHSIMGLAILLVGLAFVPGLPAWVAAAVVLGCAVHIAGDACTVSGVPLLWPLERRFGPRLFETGSFVETGVLVPLFCAGTILFGVLAVRGAV